MKTIKIDLPSEIDGIELVPIGDLHLGDAMSDWEHIQRLIKYVQDTPNAYAVLLGDLMDTAVASSIGDTYGENLRPMEQLRQCEMIFEPIKDKILAVVHGNHENRVYKTDGLDLTQIMCNQLGISDRYSATTALLFIRFGRDKSHGKDPKHRDRKLCYTVYLSHGSGGGRKEGGKINRLADLAQIVDADVYICGHTHLPASFRCGYYRVSSMTSSVQFVSKLFVNTSAALNYGGYGDIQGYKPGAKECPIIRMSGTEKRMTAEL